jgi:hypothetical protein
MMLSKPVERFDPDSYRVREGDAAMGEAKPIEDDDGLPRRSLRRREDEDKTRGAGRS